jgi:hypothetical protein
MQKKLPRFTVKSEQKVFFLLLLFCTFSLGEGKNEFEFVLDEWKRKKLPNGIV